MAIATASDIALSTSESTSSQQQQARHVSATAHEVTTSVNRSFSDLDTTRFACATAALCAVRTAIQHPITLALTRKQTCTYAASMSTREVLSAIMRSEGGPRALLQGMSAMVLACAVSEAVYLVMIEWLRENIPLGDTEGFGRDAVSAYTADVASRFIYLPMSIVAFRQMTQHQFTSANPQARSSNSEKIARRGMLSTLKGMYAEGGIRSVYCGLGVTLLIGSQWSALWWAGYLQLKSVAYAACSPFLLADNASSKWNWATSRDDNVILNTAVSVVTSSATALLFNPFFVLRINMQLTARATIAGTTKELYRRGGLRAFYQGAQLNMLSSTVDGVLASTSYEYAKILADRTRQH